MEDNRMKRLFISLLLLLTPFALIQGEKKDDKRERGQDSRYVDIDDKYVDDKPKIMEELDQLKKLTQMNCEIDLKDKIRYMKKMYWWINHSNISLPFECGGLYKEKEPNRRKRTFVTHKNVDFLGEVIDHTIRENRDFGNKCDIKSIELLIKLGGDATQNQELLPWDEDYKHSLESLTALQVSEKEKIVEDEDIKNMSTSKNSHCAARIFKYLKDVVDKKEARRKMLEEKEVKSNS